MQLGSRSGAVTFTFGAASAALVRKTDDIDATVRCRLA
jgi:hypothetical protein